MPYRAYYQASYATIKPGAVGSSLNQPLLPQLPSCSSTDSLEPFPSFFPECTILPTVIPEEPDLSQQGGVRIDREEQAGEVVDARTFEPSRSELDRIEIDELRGIGSGSGRID